MGPFVRVRNPVPSILIMAIWGAVRSARVNATLVPSGDISGIAAPGYPVIASSPSHQIRPW